MKFLVDEQLPPALVAWLQSQGCEADHVRNLGLARGDDSAVWAQAARGECVIITKDEDYVDLIPLRPETVPVIWVRIGNCTNRALIQWLAPLFPDILAKLKAGERLIELSR